MNLIFNHPYRYAAERVIRSFGGGFDYAFSEIKDGNFKVEARRGDKVAALSENYGGDEKIKICSMLYDALGEITGISPSWGVFTGVRPIKYIRENRDLAAKMKISAGKLALADEIIGVQKSVIGGAPKNSFHLYVGIPFCPSRCGYCSFVSETAGKTKALIPKYVNLLIRELEIIGGFARARGLRPDTVYIGGGTPTAIPAAEQRRVYGAVGDYFDLSAVREYTVEAGRPDTLDAETLREIKRAGAGRISVNPQSMNDAVLKAVGRDHGADDTTRAFELSRGYGFENINMDLIAGLPGESESGFAESLKRVAELKPDNITVHSLAFKRGSLLEKAPFADGLTETAYTILKGRGYFPYYLYRLRESAADGDNIGYSRDAGKIGLYNVYAMDESASVLAAGCAGATRIIGDGFIKKRYNFKYPHEYISRFGEIAEDKKALFNLCRHNLLK
ncbi:MAG: coproporphyrinogen dehydrogenase HemZ [Oscillospiraceae bacterium]|jgi:oxygen-independent coproporphyrinogen-3 oxidase|nr:coproporphyrinogen dehydrogenase HemZ [Oscillospiraceae bacterium]